MTNVEPEMNNTGTTNNDVPLRVEWSDNKGYALCIIVVTILSPCLGATAALLAIAYWFIK